MRRPPRLAAWLVAALLPRDLGEVVAGDLEEDWRARGGSGRGRHWRLAVASIAAHWRGRLGADDDEAACERGGSRKRERLLAVLAQDVAFGLRLLRRQPGFALAAIVTLALGIGANAAIFSIVDVLSLKPLFYRDPSRVAFVLGWNVERDEMRFNLSLADFADLRARSRALDDAAAYVYWSANLSSGDRPERVQAYRVTANTFALLGVPALLGRTLGPEDGRPGGPAGAIVLGHGLWQRRFAGDPDVLGRRILLDGEPHTVVGVMPRQFEFPVFNFKGDLWAPLHFDEAAPRTARGGSSGVVIARLREGISYPAAQAELDTIMQRLAAEHPRTNRDLGARLVAMGRLDDMHAGAATPVVAAAVGIVLLLACANVAGLLLARGLARRRELALRAALGASRGRLARQLLTESLLLAAAGGAAGVAVAHVALRALRRSLPDVVRLTQPMVDELGVDGATLLFTSAVSVAAGLVFGVMPALRAARPDLHDALRDGGTTSGAAGHTRLRSVLVAAEVALSLVLLVGAGLLVRSFQRLRTVDPGFDAEGVLTLAVALPETRYGEPGAQRRFFETVLERVRTLPGVSAAGFVNVLPFSTYDRGTRIEVEGRPRPDPGREPRADYRVATPGYFPALGIGLVRGRVFDRGDSADAAPVAIVNRTLVKRDFGGEDPVGRRIRMAEAEGRAPWRTIVGVVEDVQHSQLGDRPAPELYLPAAQAPTGMMMLAARTAGEPMDLAAAVQREILAVDPDQPAFHVRTMERMVGDSMLPQTSAASLMLLFGIVALALTGVGVYGIVSYAVGQQTREIGVRVALGATPRDIVGLVLRRGVVVVGVGGLLGLAGAAAASRLLGAILFGVGTADPAAYGGALLLLALVALVASYLPARRALRVDPVTSLKAD